MPLPVEALFVLVQPLGFDASERFAVERSESFFRFRCYVSRSSVEHFVRNSQQQVHYSGSDTIVFLDLCLLPFLQRESSPMRFHSFPMMRDDQLDPTAVTAAAQLRSIFLPAFGT